MIIAICEGQPRRDGSNIGEVSLGFGRFDGDKFVGTFRKDGTARYWWINSIRGKNDGTLNAPYETVAGQEFNLRLTPNAVAQCREIADRELLAEAVG